MELNAVAILARWMHVTSACVLIGSVYYYQFVLPAGAKELDVSAADSMLRRGRRPFKMTVHVTLLLFLISGIYNAIRNWPIYTRNPGVMHGMFGMHLLLGLGGITVLMLMLAGREPRPARAGWAKWTFIMLLLAVAAASTLKSAREWTMTHETHGVVGSSAR